MGIRLFREVRFAARPIHDMEARPKEASLEGQTEKRGIRRFGVAIACANLGVLLTVAWWLGWPAEEPVARPVDAVLADGWRRELADDLSQASFRLYGDEARAELRKIFDRHAEELERELHVWFLRYTVPARPTPGR